jgi:ATPase subunit of ABC transporter with duplicated ATPase domains
MPAFVILDSISLTTPDGRPLFDGLTLAQARERTGIVGRNGSGKSTLLRLIRGEVEPAGGSVRRIGSIGMLAQLADERETIAQALRVADDLACLAGLKPAKVHSTMPPRQTGRWKRGYRRRLLKPACPACRSNARSPL